VEEEIQAFDRSRLTPVTTEEKHFLPTAEDIQTEALHKELDSLDNTNDDDNDEGGKGAVGLRDFLTKDPVDTIDTTDSSSSPEEIPAAGVGAGALKNLLERETRERSSSGEEWEKVSINTEEYPGQAPSQDSSEC